MANVFFEIRSEAPENSSIWTVARPFAPGIGTIFQDHITSWRARVFLGRPTEGPLTAIYDTGTVASTGTAPINDGLSTSGDDFNEDAHAALWTIAEGLQTDTYWDEDTTGYSFRYRLENTKFIQDGGSRIKVELALTTTAGDPIRFNHIRTFSPGGLGT